MNIALWNASGLRNIGDRILDQVNRREVKKRLPNCSFTSFCPWSSFGRTEHLRVSRSGTWTGTGRYDGIIIGGGALLMGPPFAHPGLQHFYLGPSPRDFQDRCPIIWNAVCSDAQYLAPLFEEWRAYVRSAAERLAFVSVRNERTKDFLTDCSVLAEIKVVPDPALTFLEPKIVNRPRRERPVIGVIVARPTYTSSFIEAMKRDALVEMAEANDAVVSLRNETGVNCHGDDLFKMGKLCSALETLSQYFDLHILGIDSMYGDAEYAAEISANLSNHSLKHVSDLIESEVLHWIDNVDCLIASRLHHCILGIISGKPLVGIDMAFDNVIRTSKLHQFMIQADHLDFHVPYENIINGSSDLAYLADCALRRTSLIPQIHESLKNEVDGHFDKIAAYFM